MVVSEGILQKLHAPEVRKVHKGAGSLLNITEAPQRPGQVLEIEGNMDSCPQTFKYPRNLIQT